MAWDPKDLPRCIGLEINGYGADGLPIEPFWEPIGFEFDPEVNVFIGPNATGKSTILRLLCPQLKEWQPSGGCKRSYSDPRPGVPHPDRIPHIYFPPVREVAPLNTSGLSNPLTPGPDEKPRYDEWLFNILLDPEPDLDDFGDDRRDDPVDDHLGEFVGLWKDRDEDVAWDQLCKYGPPEKLGEVVEPGWLSREARATLRRASPYKFNPAVLWRAFNRILALGGDVWIEQVAWAAEQTDKCILAICPEMVKGGLTNLVYDAKRLPDDASPTRRMLARGGKTYPLSAIRTVDPVAVEGSAEYWLGELSTGTQGLIWWIFNVALSLAFHGQNSLDRIRGGESIPGVLCIDEIENHLHPTWQRRVIPALRKHFPGLQIFATTHSPFVVAGLKRGQVHRLYREKEVIKTDQLTEEEKEHKLVGWTVEEILQEFMDVEDPTDEETALAAATLRWLQERFPPDDPDDPHYLASDWVRDKILRRLRDNPERLPEEEQSLRWLSENQPDGQSDDSVEDENQQDSQSSATTEDENQPDSQSTAKDLTAKKWWLDTIEKLRSATGPNLEDWGPIAARADRLMEEIRRVADYGIDEEPEDEEG